MQLLEIILIALSLSFDTFAVSVSAGIVKKSIRFWQGVRIAVVLAFFQALMPLLGWFGGSQIEKYLLSIDHWIAFTLLSAVGVKMIIDAFRDEQEKAINPLLLKVAILMGLATSIDALVVGVSLAFIEIKIYQSIVIIGIITFLAAMVGMFIGKCATDKLGKKFEIAGGLILIGIGVKILIEHLG